MFHVFFVVDEKWYGTLANLDYSGISLLIGASS